MNDPYELWMWLWLALLVLAWIAAVLFSAWVDSRKPKRVRRDWATEQRCKATRRAFKTRAGIR